MQIALITFDGFNELDSFIATSILNRMIARAGSLADAEEAMRYVAPVRETDVYVTRALAVVSPFLAARADAACAADVQESAA